METTYAYDALGRKQSACVGVQAGGACALELGWTWSDNDRLLEASRRLPGGVDLATTYDRNALGWVTRVVHPDLEDEHLGYDVLGRVRFHQDEADRVTTTTWDDWGRPTGEDRPDQLPRYHSYSFGSAGSPEVHTTIEPDGGAWTTSYDFAGRAVAEEYADGTGLERVYDGSRLTEVWHLDSGWNATAVDAYEYDAFGRVAAHWGPVDASVYTPGGWTEGTDYVFQYDRTDEGRMLSVRGPNDVTNFVWGPDGLLESEEIVGVTTHTYSYDLAWGYPRLNQVETSDGTATRTLARAWDPSGLWVQEETTTEGGNSLVKTFGAWDAYGTPKSVVSAYGPTGAEALQVAYSLATSERGQTTLLEVETGSGWLGSVFYDWEADGAIGRVATSWAGSVDHFYDGPTGALVRVENVATGSAVATFPLADRDPLGRAGRVELAGGGLFERAWDTHGRASSWVVESGAGVSEARSYAYDARGRLETRTTTRSTGVPEVEDFTYEEPGWLAGETKTAGTVASSTVYDYDAAGNRTQRTVDGVAGELHTYAFGNALGRRFPRARPPKGSAGAGSSRVTWG